MKHLLLWAVDTRRGWRPRRDCRHISGAAGCPHTGPQTRLMLVIVGVAVRGPLGVHRRPLRAIVPLHVADHTVAHRARRLVLRKSPLSHARAEGVGHAEVPQVRQVLSEKATRRTDEREVFVAQRNVVGAGGGRRRRRHPLNLVVLGRSRRRSWSPPRRGPVLVIGRKDHWCVRRAQNWEVNGLREVLREVDFNPGSLGRWGHGVRRAGSAARARVPCAGDDATAAPMAGMAPSAAAAHAQAAVALGAG